MRHPKLLCSPTPAAAAREFPAAHARIIRARAETTNKWGAAVGVHVRRFIAVFLAAAVWQLSSLAAAAAPETKRLRPAGDLFTSGRVLIDGADAANGTSFFSGS